MGFISWFLKNLAADGYSRWEIFGIVCAGVALFGIVFCCICCWCGAVQHLCRQTAERKAEIETEALVTEHTDPNKKSQDRYTTDLNYPYHSRECKDDTELMIIKTISGT